MGIEERQLLGVVRLHEHGQHLAAEQTRQHVDVDQEVGARGDPSRAVGRRRIGRAFEPGGEPLAALDMTTLRVWVELARSHVLDHALTQRTDSGSVAHGNSHPE